MVISTLSQSFISIGCVFFNIHLQLLISSSVHGILVLDYRGSGEEEKEKEEEGQEDEEKEEGNKGKEGA